MLEARERMAPVYIGPSEALITFSHIIPSQNMVNEIVARHRNLSGEQKSSFSVLPVIGAGRHRHEKYGEPGNKKRKFFIDGDLGFLLLGHPNPEHDRRIGLAEVSFSLHPLRGYPGIVDHDTRQYPRIVQMQGCTYEGDKDWRRDMALELLKSFQMGKVLLDLVTEFARMNDFPAVGVLPAASNLNKGKRGFNLEKLKIRYEITARRQKFFERPGGLLVKEIAESYIIKRHKPNTPNIL